MILSRSMHRRSLFIAVALLALLGMFAALRPQTASAHPLGNFTINRYSRVEIGAQDIGVRYVLDMAEIPTFQEMKAIPRREAPTARRPWDRSSESRG